MATDSTLCHGCYDDFYNREREGGCWSLKKAKVVTRYRIHRDVVPTKPRAFTEVKGLSCFHNPPMFYYDKLPDFVKAEDVVRP